MGRDPAGVSGKLLFSCPAARGCPYAETAGGPVPRSPEQFGLYFPGKRHAKTLCVTETRTVMTPDTAHNSLPENGKSGNMYICGDSLDALKHLLVSHSGAVKCIYIDPPYNTGSRSFVYADRFRFPPETLKEVFGAAGEGTGKISGGIGYRNASRAAWLSFMYPRLYLARGLLSDDGVIYISIDDKEYAYLKLLCDEIFGEANLVGVFLWKKKGTSVNVANTVISSQTDYQLCYAKRKSASPALRQRTVSPADRTYPYSDERGRYRTVLVEKKDTGTSARPTMKYRILGRLPRENRRWQMGEKTAREHEAAGDFIVENGIVKLKKYRSEEKFSYSAHPNLLTDCGSTASANRETNTELFGRADIFSNPKPVRLIHHLVSLATGPDSVVLDFFSGSATTAHAVMQLNADDGGSRTFIMVQLPEKVRPGSEAAEAGFGTVCDIGMERIRLAARQIRARDPLFAGDTGFRRFVLTTDMS